MQIREPLGGASGVAAGWSGKVRGGQEQPGHGVRVAASVASNQLASDTVTLSAHRAGLLRAAAAAGPDLNGAEDSVRAAKVAALQSTIAAGTYHVPAADVADRIIDHLTSLGPLSHGV